MSQANNIATSAKTAPKRSRKLRRWFLVIIIIAIIGTVYAITKRPEEESLDTTFLVRRGSLEITVVEGGSVKALESQEIKSEVRGSTKILGIVEEGYLVTEEDVANGKILVELDSSELEEHIVDQETIYLSALASLTQAQTSYEIQISQNESQIKSAELLVKFKKMDFEKYLGNELASDVLAKQETNDQSEDLGYASLAHDERLGGEAEQMKKDLEADILLAGEELSLAVERLDWTQKLHEKGFVTDSDRNTDEMNVKRKEISGESTKIKSQLFFVYDFTKRVEQLLADYQEAIRELDRTMKQAAASLVRDKSQVDTQQIKFRIQEQRRDDHLEQLKKCVIRAERPGLVVYGGSDSRSSYYGSSREPIAEGSSVHERQSIITIPDMTRMSVLVKIHESSVKKVQKGQRAKIRIDAYPEVDLYGEVVKVAVLPDYGNRYMNPDMKVYNTSVTIDAVEDWLKPGLSAEATILINRIEDALHVPIQAVFPGSDGKRYCFIVKPEGPERREVTAGEFNEEYIQIVKGLEENERVYLRVPRGFEEIQEIENANYQGQPTTEIRDEAWNYKPTQNTESSNGSQSGEGQGQNMMALLQAEFDKTKDNEEYKGMSEDDIKRAIMKRIAQERAALPRIPGFAYNERSSEKGKNNAKPGKGPARTKLPGGGGKR